MMPSELTRAASRFPVSVTSGVADTRSRSSAILHTLTYWYVIDSHWAACFPLTLTLNVSLTARYLGVFLFLFCPAMCHIGTDYLFFCLQTVSMCSVCHSWQSFAVFSFLDSFADFILMFMHSYPFWSVRICCHCICHCHVKISLLCLVQYEYNRCVYICTCSSYLLNYSQFACCVYWLTSILFAIIFQLSSNCSHYAL